MKLSQKVQMDTPVNLAPSPGQSGDLNVVHGSRKRLSGKVDSGHGYII